MLKGFCWNVLTGLSQEFSARSFMMVLLMKKSPLYHLFDDHSVSWKPGLITQILPHDCKYFDFILLVHKGSIFYYFFHIMSQFLSNVMCLIAPEVEQIILTEYSN